MKHSDYFNGQRVAVRVAGVLSWLVGDHLGSTTVTANGASGERTAELWYKPWGETRGATDAATPTKRRFTGQVLDEVAGGLYFYNARYYDPALGRFASADTLIPNPGNPQDLNRYSYVGNRPLTFDDPTGCIAQNEADTALKIIQMLQQLYGVIIKVDFGWHPAMHPSPGGPSQVWEEGAWELQELDTVQEGIQDLASIMGGAQGFAANFGGVEISRAKMEAAGLGKSHQVTLNARGFSKWTLVHELAHAWDAANGWGLSEGLEQFTGGVTTGILFWRKYQWGDVPAKGADENFNKYEDFAESLTAFLYPEEAQAYVQQNFGNQPQFQYANYYQTRRALYVARQAQISFAVFKRERDAW